MGTGEIRIPGTIGYKHVQLIVWTFVNPPAIRGDVHAQKVSLCARVTATLGTATVKINSYGHRFPLDVPVFSFKDWL